MEIDWLLTCRYRYYRQPPTIIREGIIKYILIYIKLVN